MLDLFHRYGFQILVPRLDRMAPEQRREILEVYRERGAGMSLTCGAKEGLHEPEWVSLASSVSFQRTHRGDVMGVFARLASGICPEGHGRLVHMDRETPEDLDQDQILLLQEEGSWDLIRSPRYGDSRTPRPGPELRAVLHGLYHEGNLSGEGGDPELGELCRLLNDKSLHPRRNTRAPCRSNTAEQNASIEIDDNTLP